MVPRKSPPGARPLCNRVPRDSREGAAYHLFHPSGTAHRAFGSLVRPPERQQRVNGLLRDFALGIIKDRPLDYAAMVGADFLRYFRPGQRSRYISDLSIAFPDAAELQGLDPGVKRRFYPDLEPTAREHAALLRSYQAVVHVPRWLLAPLALAGLLVMLASVFRRARRRMPRCAEVLLLAGGSLCVLLGATATSEFVLRYLVAVVPLLVTGGLAACLDLRSLPSSPAPDPNVKKLGRIGERGAGHRATGYLVPRSPRAGSISARATSVRTASAKC